jgi:hypothetical protein
VPGSAARRAATGRILVVAEKTATRTPSLVGVEGRQVIRRFGTSRSPDVGCGISRGVWKMVTERLILHASTTGEAAHDPVGLLNSPRVWWAQGDLSLAGSPGGWIRLFGVNLAGTGSHEPAPTRRPPRRWPRRWRYRMSSRAGCSAPRRPTTRSTSPRLAAVTRASGSCRGTGVGRRVPSARDNHSPTGVRP